MYMAIDIAIPVIFTVPSIGSSNAAQAEPTYHNTPAERRVTVPSRCVSASLIPPSGSPESACYLAVLPVLRCAVFCACCVCSPLSPLVSRLCPSQETPSLAPSERSSERKGTWCHSCWLRSAHVTSSSRTFPFHLLIPTQILKLPSLFCLPLLSPTTPKYSH